MTLRNVTSPFLVVIAALGLITSATLWRKIQDNPDASVQSASWASAPFSQRSAPGRSAADKDEFEFTENEIARSRADKDDLGSKATSVYRSGAIEDQQYWESQKTRARALIPRSYPDLQEALGLDQAQTDELIDVILDHQFASFAQASTDPSSGDVDDPAKAYAERLANRESDLSRVLGPKYETWKEYRRTLFARQRLSQLRHALEVGPEPLSSTQQQLMFQLLRADPAHQTSIAGPIPVGRVAGSQSGSFNLESIEQHHSSLLEAAQGYLTPYQLKTLKGLLDESRVAGQTKTRVGYQ
jgi:hypothetical protein